MGSVVLYGILPVEDHSTDEAEAFAREVLSGDQPLDIPVEKLDTAQVGRFDGLVIYSASLATKEMSDGLRVGVHFRTPLAGYKGNGPATSAAILSKFGFGDEDELFEKINHGESGAHFLLTTGMNKNPAQ